MNQREKVEHPSMHAKPKTNAEAEERERTKIPWNYLRFPPFTTNYGNRLAISCVSPKLIEEKKNTNLRWNWRERKLEVVVLSWIQLIPLLYSTGATNLHQYHHGLTLSLAFSYLAASLLIFFIKAFLKNGDTLVPPCPILGPPLILVICSFVWRYTRWGPSCQVLYFDLEWTSIPIYESWF